MYRQLLASALAASYHVESVEAFWRRISAGTIDQNARYLIVRHDIDSGPRTARLMWMIERSLGIHASYYFRLKTLDLGLMRRIGADGGEASYHYEELATVAKRRHIRDPGMLRRFIPEAQALFARNLERLRRDSGQPMRTVASHGDFVNRDLGVINHELLADAGFRASVGIELETYDDAFMAHVTSRHADLMYPEFWTPSAPEEAIAAGEHVVYLLIHSRGWNVEPLVNARDDLERLWEGAVFGLPVRPRLAGARSPVSAADDVRLARPGPR
jgi:hypothetical protein